MSDIHYFPRYSQKENFVTNNTLLLLLRLYQYSRYRFQSFMEKLCEDEPGLQLSTSWLHFQQQKATDKSVLDGFISQDSIKIAVETKLGDSFDSAQLDNHLTVFKDEQHKLLIMLSPANRMTDSEIAAVRAHAAGRNVQILPTSFEKIIQVARWCLPEHEEEMRSLVDDFESFCSESKLLPNDQYLMFVPPCGVSYKDNIKYALYYCDATWNRRKTKYLGIYADKAVRAVGRINKVVECTVNVESRDVRPLPGEGRTETLTADEQRRILHASIDGRAHGWDLTTGEKFYLCDEFAETEFRKESHGGIYGHRYLDLRDFLGPTLPATIADLAVSLKQRQWK
jgi:hypothetical protein